MVAAMIWRKLAGVSDVGLCPYINEFEKILGAPVNLMEED
jgi:hypothetical protein